MNGALAAIVARIVNDNEGASYNGMMIYVMAMYAFYAVAIAVVNLVKLCKYGSPVLSAIKAVSLTSALVSMLSLETAMLDDLFGVFYRCSLLNGKFTKKAALCIVRLLFYLFDIAFASCCAC